MFRHLMCLPCADESGAGRGLLARELTHGTFSVFSVLHDPVEGEALSRCSPYPTPQTGLDILAEALP